MRVLRVLRVGHVHLNRSHCQRVHDFLPEGRSHRPARSSFELVARRLSEFAHRSFVQCEPAIHLELLVLVDRVWSVPGIEACIVKILKPGVDPMQLVTTELLQAPKEGL